MTRIQTFPQQSVTAFAALFEAGSDPFIVYYEQPDTFASEVTTHTAYALNGIAYDPVKANFGGCWRFKTGPTRFAWNQNWNSLAAANQTAAAAGLGLRCIAAYPDARSFEDFFSANLAPFVMGYAYAVAKDGQVIASGSGFARSPQEAQNAGSSFTIDTRMNLASVSKFITGITLERLLLDYSISIDAPFWPLIQAKVPNPNPAVKTVTLRNLATHKSGLQPDSCCGGVGPANPAPGQDFWEFINAYLAQPLAGTPGVTYVYNNDNFTILQGVIEEVSQTDYPDYVTSRVLVPALIDPDIFNVTTDSPATATLAYSDGADARPGQYFPSQLFVAPGGWVANVRELIKLLIALRGSSVLPSDVVAEMLNDGIGNFSYKGTLGTYYYHSGGDLNAAAPPQYLQSFAVRFTEGYDLALLTNSTGPPVNGVAITCFEAFEARGLTASQLPSNTITVTALANAASGLSNASPGSYIAIFGSGFSSQPAVWDSAIGTDGTLPQELNGVRVFVDSQPSYIEYVGPTQINILLPTNTPTGDVSVDVTTPSGGISTLIKVHAISPALFTYRPNGTLYPLAIFAEAALVYVAPTGAVAGANSRPAQAGDIIELYGSGMGPTEPPAPDGVVFATAYPASAQTSFLVTLGGQQAEVLYAGMINAGLFLLNVQVPDGVGGGDQPLNLLVNGVPAQSNLFLALVA